MPASSSCTRCLRPLTEDSVSGLCPVCLGTGGSADTSPITPPASGPLPATLSVGAVVARPAAAETVSSPPAADTRTAGVAADTRPPGLPTEVPGRGPGPPDRPSPPGYELLARLGRGGMGTVYLARELATERTVAMKFLASADSPAALERFLIEVRALARFEHPNVVRIHAAGFLRADPFFTMEYAAGGTLADRVQAEGPLPPRDAARVMAPVCRAVAAAHAASVLHRDLKPSNVLLTTDGTPKVSDFGLAKRLDVDDGITAPAGAMGTPGFMPPEQATAGGGSSTPVSDVYGLGATLYYLVTGRPPFTGDSADVISKLRSGQEPQRPGALRPDLPADLEAVVVKCLEKDPDRRFATAAELADELEAFADGRPMKTRPPSRLGRVRWWARRNRHRIAAGAAVLVAAVGLVALGIVLARPKPPPDPREEIRKELAAGRPVTLVGKTGLPRWHSWPVGATALAESPVDGACEFETIQHALLELLDDPGVDRYRVTASLRIRVSKLIPATVADPRAGMSEAHHLALYFGHSACLATDGFPAHLFLAVTYNDYLSPEARKIFIEKIKRPAEAAAQAKAVIVALRPGLPDSSTYSASLPKRFPPVDRYPGEWRRVAIEVTPDRVTYSWADKEDDPPQPFDAVGPDRLNGPVVGVAEAFTKANPGVSLPVPPWQPRKGLGVWCRGCAVSVRSVVIEPLP